MSKQPTTRNGAITEKSDEPQERPRRVPRSSVSNALVVEAFAEQTCGKLDLKSLVIDLGEQCDVVHKGDLARAEAMLMSQANSLEAIFSTLARRAAHAEHMPQLEVNLRLGLKAQSQCRATLETLAAIKNPPVFAKQANIAHGAQQVNNEAGTAARVKNIEIRPNELLEHEHGKRLDTSASRTPNHRNQRDKAVVALDGPKKRSRQSKRQS